MTVVLPDPAPQPADPDRDERVRTQFARQCAQMLRDHGHHYAAELVLAERTDGGWP